MTIRKKPTPVSDLLEQGEGMLKRLRAGMLEAERSLTALRAALPPELAREVWSATLRGTTLTAFVSTGAWATRLRYVVPKLAVVVAARLGTPVEEIKVKVRAGPRRGQTPTRWRVRRRSRSARHCHRGK